VAGTKAIGIDGETIERSGLRVEGDGAGIGIDFFVRGAFPAPFRKSLGPEISRLERQAEPLRRQAERPGHPRFNLPADPQGPDSQGLDDGPGGLAAGDDKSLEVTFVTLSTRLESNPIPPQQVVIKPP
jgi:hypothetical protein